MASGKSICDGLSTCEAIGAWNFSADTLSITEYPRREPLVTRRDHGDLRTLAHALASLAMGHCSVCGAPTVDGDDCASCDAAEWAPALNMIYQPPYSEFGASYGPRTAGAAHRELQEFETVRYGAVGSPAQWDEREEPRAARRVAVQEAPRKDADVFEARIAVLAPRMARRELECAMLFWRSRMSVGRIAGHMSVKESTVREWIRRTRERLALR